MTLDIAAAAKLLSPVAQKVAPILFKKVQSKLNPTELEKALEAGITAAQEQEQNFPPQQWLFYRSEPDFIGGFLEQFFQRGGVQEELQRPLKGEGISQVPYLVEAFKQVAATNSKIKLQEDRIEPWLQKFASTYFEKTSTFLRFQVAKEDYFKQLENYFDDVKFAGIAVEGQEIDFKSEKLAQIFVMLDVVEDVQNPLIFYFASHGLFGNRQEELLWEQQQRSQLENRSGKKISAVQLLSQSQSQKVVLLGAPGSGKTTLMSYFAVMLAQKHPEKLGLAADTDWLPILIRIRDLARHPNLNILDYARQFANNTLCVNPLLPLGFFEYWLEDGRALILLDGLDEVPEEGRRDEV
ncbi:MAG: NACHT domain-containing protein, partial [Cyanobacteriota bacterium]